MPKLTVDDVTLLFDDNSDHLLVQAPSYYVVDVVHEHATLKPQDWHRGYQEALRDVAARLADAGPAAAADWITAAAGDADTTEAGRRAQHAAKRWHEPPL